MFDSVCELLGETIRNIFWAIFLLNAMEVSELGLGITNPVGTGGVWCLGCDGVGRGLGPGSGRVLLCLESLCRWQVQLSAYCARRIPAHLMCTHCSILTLSIFAYRIFVCGRHHKSRPVCMWLSDMDQSRHQPLL